MLRTTPQERQALGITALLLAAGAGVRLLSVEPAPPAWVNSGNVVADTPSVGALRGEVEVERGREKVRSTPLAPGERIDPNRASADELDRLPRVGPALARRIVEWRDARGRIRSLASLDSVPGVGPKLLADIAPHLTLPAEVAAASPGAPPPRLDLNRASAAELDALPGIGPVIAERIVAWRQAHGPFRSLDDLTRVSGIGPALRDKLAPLLHVGS